MKCKECGTTFSLRASKDLEYPRFVNCPMCGSQVTYVKEGGFHS